MMPGSKSVNLFRPLRLLRLGDRLPPPLGRVTHHDRPLREERSRGVAPRATLHIIAFLFDTHTQSCSLRTGFSPSGRRRPDLHGGRALRKADAARCLVSATSALLVLQLLLLPLLVAL